MNVRTRSQLHSINDPHERINFLNRRRFRTWSAFLGIRRHRRLVRKAATLPFIENDRGWTFWKEVELLKRTGREFRYLGQHWQIMAYLKVSEAPHDR